MRHFLATGQKVKAHGNSFVPSFTSEHVIVALNDDWSIVRCGEDFKLCLVTGQEELSTIIKARFKSGPVLIGCDLQHTWAELQDFRFAQSNVTGSAGVWFMTRWLKETMHAEHDFQINTTPLYGKSLKKCLIKGGPIDITEQCV